MSENKNPEILKFMKQQLEAYGQALSELASMFGVEDIPKSTGNTKEKAVGTAEVKKASESTDNDPED